MTRPSVGASGWRRRPQSLQQLRKHPSWSNALCPPQRWFRSWQGNKRNYVISQKRIAVHTRVTVRLGDEQILVRLEPVPAVATLGDTGHSGIATYGDIRQGTRRAVHWTLSTNCWQR
jgi:hypothetical protein